MLILSSNTTEFERITGATTAQINFSTEEIQTEFYPHFNDQLFGALNPITIFITKFGQTELFRAGMETHNARNVLEPFRRPAFSPQCIRLKPRLQRKGKFATTNNKEYQDLLTAFSKLNEGFKNPAKENMIKDKELVIKEAVQHSKDLLLVHLLRTMVSSVEARTPAKLSVALLDHNDDDHDCSIREPTSDERSLTAGFSVFVSLALKAKLLSHYSGHRNSVDLMNHVANFILVPKLVTTIKTWNPMSRLVTSYSINKNTNSTIYR